MGWGGIRDPHWCDSLMEPRGLLLVEGWPTVDWKSFVWPFQDWPGAHVVIWDSWSSDVRLMVQGKEVAR